MTPGFDQVADELYGLPVDEFVPARTRYEKESRQAGDRDLADRIRGLTKPNQAAWLANQLVRQHRGDLEPLLDLGTRMREATRALAGDQLRQLSRQQHDLVTALVQQARTLGRAQGHKVSEDTARAVSDTLHAALVDEDAAELLLTGRLSAPLHRSGFGDGPAPADVTHLQAARPPRSTPRKTPRATPRTKSDDKLAEAQRALDAATSTRDGRRAEAEQAARAAHDAHAKVDELRSELEQATAIAARADRHQRERDGALRRAEQAVAEAERKVGAAKR